jgi:hypothetical protein
MEKVLEFKVTNGKTENQILGLGGEAKFYYRMTDIANGVGKINIEIEFGNNGHEVHEIDKECYVQGDDNACLNLVENTSNFMKLNLEKGTFQLGSDKENLIINLQLVGPGKTKENGGN